MFYFPSINLAPQPIMAKHQSCSSFKKPCTCASNSRLLKHGFTIIELLVVIAILGLLIGLFVPTLGLAVHQSRVSKDMASLRSLQVAHYSYATDSKGEFADAGLAHGGLANEKIAWLNLLAEYVDIKVVRSPLDTSPHWDIPVEGTTDRFRRTSYGWNNYLSRTHSPDAAIDPLQAADCLSMIKKPANIVHFLHMASTGSLAGADHVHVENWWVNDSLPDAPPVLASNQVETNIVSGIAQSSSATSNYGFVDGHVETVPFSNVYIRPGQNRFDPKISSFYFE